MTVRGAILVFIAVWLAVFTASMTAYWLVYATESVYTDSGGTWTPGITPSPWVTS